MEACIVLAAAMLAFPALWRYKLPGLALGMIAVQTEAPWQAEPLSDPKTTPVRRSPRWHPGKIWH